jgi:uncharacterized protein (DUF58 family)
VSLQGPLAPPPVEARARPMTRFGAAFGPRFFILLLIGLIWLAPAFADSRFVYVMAAWDALIIMAWLVDLFRLPGPAQLRVRRSWPAPSALSVESHVELTVFNESAVPVRTRILDHVPPQLRVEPPELQIDVGSNREAGGRYLVLPNERGEARLGEAYVRYQSPLKIAERWARADLAQTVVTYPNLEEAKRQAVFLVRSRQIELERRSTRTRGAGRAFESLREYREGDELRDICWTASARRGKPVTRLYEIERSQTVWILIDTGRLMRARVGGLSKLDLAVNAALALAQVALYSGDRVGVLAYGRQIEQRLPAARGSAHLKQIIGRLAAVREDEWEADHVQAATRVLTDQKRRCLIVWITDVSETAMTPEVIQAASQLTPRHLVLFVVIGQSDLKAVAARDPDSVHQMYETAAAQEIVHRRERLLAVLRERGVLALEHGSGSLSPRLVNSYLEIKERSQL